MSSTFRIYDLKVSFYGSPGDMYLIEHGDLNVAMPNAMSMKKFIETHHMESHNQVYEVIKDELRVHGYDMTRFKNHNNDYYNSSSIWIDNNTDAERKRKTLDQLKKERIHREKLSALATSFWGNIIVTECLNNGNGH